LEQARAIVLQQGKVVPLVASRTCWKKAQFVAATVPLAPTSALLNEVKGSPPIFALLVSAVTG
jgi:hypothetical protein